MNTTDRTVDVLHGLATQVPAIVPPVSPQTTVTKPESAADIVAWAALTPAVGT